MRKEVYAPKWFLDICDESKNMTQGLLYLMLEMEKKKKKSHLSSSPVCQLHFVLCNYWNVGLEILNLLSLVPKYSGLTIFKQNHKCFLWQAWTFSDQIRSDQSLSRVRLFATPWTTAYQAPPSMGFSSKSTGVGCHCLLQWLLKKPKLLQMSWNAAWQNVSSLRNENSFVMLILLPGK